MAPKPLEIKPNLDRKWEPRVKMKYIGECDADQLSKLIKKRDLLWCHERLLTAYYFYLPRANVKQGDKLLKGFENLEPGETYYVTTTISHELDKKKDRYKMIGEIYVIEVSKELRKGKTF
jgi:hypothetical protein